MAQAACGAKGDRLRMREVWAIAAGVAAGAAVFFGIEAAVLAVIWALFILWGDVLWPILGELTFSNSLFES